MRHEADDTYPWGAQIDLLLERADNVINVCEVKYAKGEFVIKAHRSLTENVKPSVPSRGPKAQST